MFDILDAIPTEWRPFALIVFIIVGAGGTALTYIRGQKKGPEAPKVQEFAMTGQMADMGPVRELIEQMGLLVQQQIRTNIVLEGLADTAHQTAETYAKHMQDVEIEEEVERRLQARQANPTRKTAPRT